jgi:hypothetical protein
MNNLITRRFLTTGSRITTNLTCSRFQSVAPIHFGGNTCCNNTTLLFQQNLYVGLFHRFFSTNVEKSNQKQPQKQQVLSPTSPTMITDDESGERYGVLLDTRKLPKLKPSIVQRRLSKCKTYEGRERNIRQSPWKINRICQLAAGLPLEDALTQLQFCDLKNSDLVAKVLKRTSNLADIRDGIQISQLEVAECFATKSTMLRRIKPMGRGR